MAQRLEKYNIKVEKITFEEKGEKVEAPKHLVNQEAKMHYDKDDLTVFQELMLAKPLVRACSDLEFDHPTIIQRMTIPAILEGNDVLAHSVTGSGKTASYLLPILQKYLTIRCTKNAQINVLRYLVL